MGSNRSGRRYTDNYYQAVAGKAHAAVALGGASPLLIHRFEGICGASGPVRSSDDTSSSPRRAIVLAAMLVAAKSMLVAEGFPKGFGKGFDPTHDCVGHSQPSDFKAKRNFALCPAIAQHLPSNCPATSETVARTVCQTVSAVLR